MKIIEERNWKSSITKELYKNNLTKFDVKCDNDHSWETCLHNLQKSTHCYQCWKNSRITKVVKNEINEKCKNTIIKGDNHGNFVLNILIKNNISAYRSIMGNNTFDIIITINNIQKRGIQVKELIKDPRKSNTFTTGFKRKYPDDTLIALINQEYNVYSLLFAQNIETTSMTFTINNTLTKYKKFLYTDLVEFENNLLKMCIKSYIVTNISNYLSYYHKKEYDMLKRLEIKCKEYNLDFILNDTNSNEIDCIINKKNIQCKFHSVPGKK